MQTDIAIVGAGLAGLALALELEKHQLNYTVFEARERCGGRILAHRTSGAVFDMGPSWFWHGQPRIATLIDRLNLSYFEQYYQGQSLYEDEQGRIAKNVGYSSMQGSLRISGGTAALTDALRTQIPEHKLHNNKRLVQVNEDGVLSFADGSQCSAKRCVLTMPPRLVSQLSFQPQLDEHVLQAMRNIPTWMAGHAKFYASYSTPFWRDKGLSGDAFSRRGPMVEIHDASAESKDAKGALFGFLGIPAEHRAGRDALMIEACVEQLSRLFGEQAKQPLNVQYKDWSADEATAIELDKKGLSHHPNYGLPSALADLYHGRLILCGTETAASFGGYMEGALVAAEKTAQLLL